MYQELFKYGTRQDMNDNEIRVDSNLKKSSPWNIYPEEFGGQSSPEHNALYIPYGCVAGTRLEKLIVEPATEDLKPPNCL